MRRMGGSSSTVLPLLLILHLATLVRCVDSGSTLPPLAPHPLPQQYTALLRPHDNYKGAGTQGRAYGDASKQRFRVEYSGPAPPPDTSEEWSVGLQLLDLNQQCMWWQNSPGRSSADPRAAPQQCLCWSFNRSSTGPLLPDWVTFSTFPEGTAYNGTTVFRGQECYKWRVPMAHSNYTGTNYWYYYETSTNGGGGPPEPVAFDTRQMVIDISSLAKEVAPELLEPPAACQRAAAPPRYMPRSKDQEAPRISDRGGGNGAVETKLRGDRNGSLLSGGLTSAADRLREGKWWGCFIIPWNITTTYDCFGKQWTITVPPQCQTGPRWHVGQKCGLIVDLHGWGMDAQMQEKNSQMAVQGHKRSFVVLQPTAPGFPPAITWNTTAASPDYDQIYQVAAHLLTAYQLDTSRVHCTGFSMGGLMTWALVSKYPKFWSSVAVASIANPYSPPKLPIPVLYQHGVHDGIVPIAKGRAAIAALRSTWHLDLQEVVSRGTGYNRTRYTSSAPGAPPQAVVDFVQHAYIAAPVGPLPLWGHCFPGSDDVAGGAQGGLLIGQVMNYGCPYIALPPGSTPFSYSDEVAEFFVAHRKPASAKDSTASVLARFQPALYRDIA